MKSAEEAIKARNPLKEWNAERLSGEVWPSVATPFHLSPGETIFTVGSCFARNIEALMAEAGFRVPALSFTYPTEEHAGPARGLLNKYTPASIFQELEWASRIIDRDGVMTEADADAFGYTFPDGDVLDNQLADLATVSRERFYERRQQLFDLFSQAFTADVVALTPGVIEAWHDRRRNLYIQELPFHKKHRALVWPDLDFHMLTFSQCKAWLSATVGLIRKHNPNAKILMTTSPVPLGRTFSGQDIITANTHAKAVLRAAVGEVCAEMAVGYFPSFEAVTLSNPGSVWEADRIHVEYDFVRKIVAHLRATYCEPITAAA